MFTAELSTITESWKQPKCPQTDGGINETWSLQTLEYYAAFKRSECLRQATTWMNHEDTVCSV